MFSIEKINESARRNFNQCLLNFVVFKILQLS